MPDGQDAFRHGLRLRVGAPQINFKCGGCGDACFCDRERQKNIRPFHKRYCNKEPIGMSLEDMEEHLESRMCALDRAKPSKKSKA
ncbi:uncharacterized protein M421DRAFT_421036 [Didymella exigua CBS 183.55]|uniref:MYND-type domain-containing protein n=1 Tax=Didymella exigua CBS 183.55 TaxID=1150837 RepID=A0A6A5RKN8_9PLEO|nr:uncharacterized protein M421DRAFT_421036 [Didymella exigua CBS 183.55]KAF1927840.1 hypothetical protein M421DRAFT_421036 [Didymella exigua CBS 183.55]